MSAPTQLARAHLPGFSHPIYLPVTQRSLHSDGRLSDWWLDVQPYYALTNHVFVPIDKLDVNLANVAAIGAPFEVRVAADRAEDGWLERKPDE